MKRSWLTAALGLLAAGAHAQNVTPRGEVVTPVAIATAADGNLHGPGIAAGQPPSAAHAKGTVFVATTRSVRDSEVGRPCVFEWDLAASRVLRQTCGKAGAVGFGGSLDFDGQRLVSLVKIDGHALLSVYDSSLRVQRQRRLAEGDGVLLATGGRLVVSSVTDPESAQAKPQLRLQVLDATLQPLVQQTLATQPGPVYAHRSVTRLGDSLYVVGAEARTGRGAVLRLDDRTLQERGRKVYTSAPAGMVSLQATAAAVTVVDTQDVYQLDPGLETVRHSRATIDAAWAAGGPQLLVAASTVSDTHVWIGCSPQWAFGTAVYACHEDDKLTMVRPDAAQLASYGPSAP